MRVLSSFLLLATLSISSSTHATAQSVAGDSHEARTARAFDAAKKQGPLALHDFLIGMPKGADLHVHLSGAVYAESFVRAAGEDGLCIDTKALSFAKPPSGGCPKVLGQIGAADMLAHMQLAANQDLYDKLIDAFSMRSFVPYAGWSGHDQFFSTFGHFGGTDKRHTGEWVDEVATRAASQNEQYMELMETPPFGHAATIAAQLGWDANLAEFRQKLLDHGLDEEVDATKEHIQKAIELRNNIEKCDSPEATPACQVKIRFIYQILRGFPKEQVFAQTLLGFETISKMPEFVGTGPVNLTVILNPDQSSQFLSAVATLNAQQMFAPAFFVVPNSTTIAAQIAGTGTPVADPTLVPGGQPAKPGSIVTLYGTGFGAENPAIATGALAPDGPAPLVTPITVTVGSTTLPASDVLYAGASPGSLGGLYQFNVRIPASTPSGPTPVTITIGGFQTQSGVTIPVQ